MFCTGIVPGILKCRMVGEARSTGLGRYLKSQSQVPTKVLMQKQIEQTIPCLSFFLDLFKQQQKQFSPCLKVKKYLSTLYPVSGFKLTALLSQVRAASSITTMPVQRFKLMSFFSKISLFQTSFLLTWASFYVQLDNFSQK